MLLFCLSQVVFWLILGHNQLHTFQLSRHGHVFFKAFYLWEPPDGHLLVKVSRLCQRWDKCASSRRAFTSLRTCLSWRLTYGSQIARHTCGRWSSMGHTESRPILWLCTVLSLSGWLFRHWQSFYNLIGVDTFWSHALRHLGSLSAFSVSLQCLHLATSQPVVPGWPLHFLFMFILVLGPVTRALVKCPAGSSEWRFWLCGIWGLWQ